MKAIFLSHFYLIKQDIYWILVILRRVHLFLVPHKVSWCYLTVPYVQPVHQLEVL